MNWRGEILITYSQLIKAITAISSPEEAQEFLSAYRQVNSYADSNIGWLIGEVDRDVGKKIIEWFGCSHPIFGTKFPTPEEALRIGMEIGEAIKNGEEISDILKRYPVKNPNPWFVNLNN